MILFLDFDGVLHPDGGDDPLFCRLPRLEALLREFPEVKVVISSMWSAQMAYIDLLTSFSDDIRLRVIDTTRISKRDAAGFLPARREEEIVEWLLAHGGPGQPWVALDDAEWAFHHHRDHLVACKSYIGLDEEAEDRLREHFEKGRTS